MMLSHTEAIFIYSLLSFITVLTAVLNLLVIISISHFRQLHTTTNFLLLSLAVADFIVGFLQMPAEILIFRGCWILGDLMCGVVLLCGYVLVSVSQLLHLTVCSLLIFSLFRQLHTTTNLLLLSLAVSDFLVGLMQMPSEILLMQSCWILGDVMCVVIYFVSYLVVSVSVGNMVLISIDRYIAICEPMFYSTRVTLIRVQYCVFLCWMFSVVHGSWMLSDFFKEPDRYQTCHGQCTIIATHPEQIVDLVVSFLAPVLVITLLYLRVFVVAVSQARAMRSKIAAVTLQRSHSKKAKKSEMKAARILGVVVVVFLLCSCPYYIRAIVEVNNYVPPTNIAFEISFLYINSCLNPVIYVFFYPWFRKAIKNIVTLQILQPGCSHANLM